MTSHFSRPALICNTQSGGHDEAVREQIEMFCRDNETPLVATFALPEGDIPDATQLKLQHIDLLLVWTGDGTINAAATQAAGWDGAILVLPGGTLNLLSKALHGDRSAPQILTDTLQGKMRRSTIPTIRSDTDTAFITVCSSSWRINSRSGVSVSRRRVPLSYCSASPISMSSVGGRRLWAARWFLAVFTAILCSQV